jgi:hypothetical protein
MLADEAPDAARMCRQEFADTRQIVQAGFWYATIQLLQLILTATFVPSADPRSFDHTQELMKAFIALCDCFGLYRMFAPRRMAQGSAAVIGLSWGGAESVLHRLVPLFVEARGLQFSWRHALSSGVLGGGLETEEGSGNVSMSCERLHAFILDLLRWRGSCK